MRYDVHDGRLLTWSLETHVTDHCNLRCEHCCTLSPFMPEHCVDPDVLARDLVLAKAALAPSVFKLTGGEPALHPRLELCLEAVRDSGIAPSVSLTSNGFALERVSDLCFRLLDRLTLSLYPSAPLSDERLAAVVSRCDAHAVELNVKWIDRFQRLDASPPHASEAQVRAIYEGCWLKERCHMLHAGRFYACTRPPHIAARLSQQAVAAGEITPDGNADNDGVLLGSGQLLAELRRYLEREEPLSACRHCLGASGGWQAHAQTARLARAASGIGV